MTGPGPIPGTLEWTAQAAQGLVPSDPFAELPVEHRPKSRPLSVIFRVDAVDTPDARAQLEEVIVTAQAMLAGLGPVQRPPNVVHLPGALPDHVRRQLANTQEVIDTLMRAVRLGPVQRPPNVVHLPGALPDPRTRIQVPPPRPWDDDPRGMGE